MSSEASWRTAARDEGMRIYHLVKHCSIRMHNDYTRVKRSSCVATANFCKGYNSSDGTVEDHRDRDRAAWWSSAATARECDARLATANVSQCQALLPPGTGTGTLEMWFTSIAPRWLEHERRCSPETVNYWGPDDFRSQPSRDTCFVVSLRDPVERLESGCRFELMRDMRYAHTVVLMGYSVGKPTADEPSLGTFVRALRDPAHPAHAYATAAAERANLRSISRRHPAILHREELVHGKVLSPFLVPQAAWVRGVRCASTDSLHAQCLHACDGAANALEASWHRFLRHFANSSASSGGVEAHGAPLPQNNSVHRRSDGFDSRSGALHPAASLARMRRQCHLEDEERAYVREELFKEDTQLFQAMCGGARCPIERTDV